MTDGDVAQRVVAIVAETLHVPVERVTPSASLMDDLGAESIDFLDILFQLETAFSIDIDAGELWRGKMAGASQHTIDANAAPSELAKLITVQTILHYLQGRGIS